MQQHVKNLELFLLFFRAHHQIQDIVSWQTEVARVQRKIGQDVEGVRTSDTHATLGVPTRVT